MYADGVADDPARFFEARALGPLLAAVGTFAVRVGAPRPPRVWRFLAERTASLVELLSHDRLGSSFVVDLVLFSLYQGWLVDDDCRRRGVDPAAFAPASAAKFVPFYGLAYYLRRAAAAAEAGRSMILRFCACVRARKGGRLQAHLARDLEARPSEACARCSLNGRFCRLTRTIFVGLRKYVLHRPPPHLLEGAPPQLAHAGQAADRRARRARGRAVAAAHADEQRRSAGGDLLAARRGGAAAADAGDRARGPAVVHGGGRGDRLAPPRRGRGGGGGAGAQGGAAALKPEAVRERCSRSRGARWARRSCARASRRRRRPSASSSPSPSPRWRRCCRRRPSAARPSCGCGARPPLTERGANAAAAAASAGDEHAPATVVERERSPS